jgi:hypothetical protein
MTQDLYYVESGYLTPDSGYYVYTADAEAAVASAATMTVAIGVIKRSGVTIVCQSTVTAVISHIHGADLVAFSNAAIATQINVIRTTNVALSGLFNVAASGVRGRYISSQVDAAATISTVNQRVRYSQAAHSAAFSLACDATKIVGAVVKEAAADLTSQFTVSALVGKRQRFEVAQVAIASQYAQADRFRSTSATIVSQAIVIANVGIVKEFVSSQSSLFTTSVSPNRTRSFASSVSSAFTPTLSVSIVKNSFAVLDSVSSLTIITSLNKLASATLVSVVSVNTSANKFTGTSVAFSSQFTLTAVGIKPTRVVGDPTITSGAGYSDLTIDTTTTKFGAGSLRFGSRSSYVSNNGITVAGNAAVSTSQKQFGAGSIFFDGVGDNISATFGSDFYFGSGDFTIELWIRPQTVSGTDYIVSLRNDVSTAPLSVLYLNNGVLRYANPTTTRITGSTLNSDTWYHIALARSGTSTKLFVNGTQVGSTYTDTNTYITGRPVFGSDYQNSVGSNFHGYMDEIRISVGIARYTANFTSPTAAFTPDSYTTLLIHGDSDITDTHADWQTILSVPSIAYPDSNKWRTWKTLDFWLYITPGHPTNGGIWHSVVGQGLVGSSNYWNLLLESSGGGTHLFALTAGAGGSWNGSSFNASNFADNQWNHIRLIYDAGSIALFVNGTKTYTWTSVNILDVDAPLMFGGNGDYVGNRGTGDVYYDEVMISEVALTSISATTFTVPTSPYTNTVNTSLLLHFDSNFFDDASQIPKILSGVANLTSAFTQSSQAIKSASGVANLASASSLTAQARKNAEIILTAFTNASLTTTVTRNRYADSNQSSVATVSVNAIRNRLASSAQASAFTQTALAVKTVSPSIATNAIFTELAAIAKTGAGFVQLDSVSTMSVSVVKTARITVDLASQFTQTTNAIKTVKTSVAVSAIATQSATITRIRNQILVYAVNSQLEAVVGKISQYNASLTAVATVVCETGKTQLFSASISSQASLTATILRIRDGSSSLASAFTQTSQTANSRLVGVASAQAAQANVTASPGTVKTSAITTNAIFSELVAVAKTGQGFITLDSPATLTVSIKKTARITAAVVSQFTETALVGKLVSASSALSSAATFAVTGTFVTTVSANFSAAYTLVCSVVKTVSVISIEASAGTMTINATATKRAVISMSALAFEVAVGKRTKTAQANLVSASTMVAKIGGTFRFRAALQGFAAEVAVIDIIHIDAKLTWMIVAENRAYSISSDNRVYSIQADNRGYVIVQENRTYAVTKELLTTELQGV